MEFETVTNSPAETIALGRAVGEQLTGGEIIGISGPLGSGKTHLIKGIAAGLGAEDYARGVTSPTFVLVNEYHGRLDIYHVDAYRLDTPADFESIGFDDLCSPNSVVLIEWADKVESALRLLDYIRITLSHAGPTQRAVRITDLPDNIRLPAS
jgi:tRNA threonylcarbamoyladenosine biosynthesis protein TsaE